MAYQLTPLRLDICVEELVTIHYFEYTKDLDYKGEAHDFWELVFLDKGEAIIRGDERCYHLKKDDCILHPPMEFHTVKAEGGRAINLVVISFSSPSRYLYKLHGDILHLEDAAKDHLCQILIEARRAFSTRLEVPEMEVLQRREQVMPGAEQMIKLHLEMLFIELIRRQMAVNMEFDYRPSIQRVTDSEVVSRAVKLMEARIREQLTIEELCRHVMVGRSQLHDLFQKELSYGVLEYFTCMKMDFAKQLIREDTMNLTQISEYLGFSSIHYFSRRFKQMVGMNPSQYRSSVKSVSEFVTS